VSTIRFKNCPTGYELKNENLKRKTICNDWENLSKVASIIVWKIRSKQMNRK